MHSASWLFKWQNFDLQNRHIAGRYGWTDRWISCVKVSQMLKWYWRRKHKTSIGRPGDVRWTSRVCWVISRTLRNWWLESYTDSNSNGSKVKINLPRWMNIHHNRSQEETGVVMCIKCTSTFPAPSTTVTNQGPFEGSIIQLPGHLPTKLRWSVIIIIIVTQLL